MLKAFFVLGSVNWAVMPLHFGPVILFNLLSLASIPPRKLSCYTVWLLPGGVISFKVLGLSTTTSGSESKQHINSETLEIPGSPKCLCCSPIVRSFSDFHALMSSNGIVCSMEHSARCWDWTASTRACNLQTTSAVLDWPVCCSEVISCTQGRLFHYVL